MTVDDLLLGLFSARLCSVVSVVTLLLLPQAQGNIWLFDDSVLISGKPAGKSASAAASRNLQASSGCFKSLNQVQVNSQQLS